MRAIPATFQAKLDSGATTMAHCWRIDPQGRAPLGFTDHDRDIAFGGVVFEAASGFSASAIEASLGLSPDNVSATGALRSERISEVDLRSGVYDGAEVRLWLVDWNAPGDRALLFRGEIGETTRGAQAFEAEVRGIGERLNRPVCRRYLSCCDLRLGDVSCGVDMTAPELCCAGAVVSVRNGRILLVSGLAAHPDDWFLDGEISWTSGARAGRSDRVKGQRRIDELVELTLAETPLPEAAAGDAFDALAGCDKSFATCRDKFANAEAFRGFPFVPGDGWLAARPAAGRPLEGGSRVRR